MNILYYLILNKQTKLSGHPNIIHFYSAAQIDKEHSEHGKAEYLILTELCTG